MTNSITSLALSPKAPPIVIDCVYLLNESCPNDPLQLLSERFEIGGCIASAHHVHDVRRCRAHWWCHGHGCAAPNHAYQVANRGECHRPVTCTLMKWNDILS